MDANSSNSTTDREVSPQEMEQVHSRQFVKLFVLFLFLIVALLLFRVENLIQPFQFVDLCIAI